MGILWPIELIALLLVPSFRNAPSIALVHKCLVLNPAEMLGFWGIENWVFGPKTTLLAVGTSNCGAGLETKKGPPNGDPLSSDDLSRHIRILMSASVSGLACTYFCVVFKLLCPSASAIVTVGTANSFAMRVAAVCRVT